MTLIQIAGASPTPPEPPQDIHLFETAEGIFALVIDGSRVYSLDDQTAQQMRSDPSAATLLGEEPRRYITDVPPLRISVRSLSLAVAQKCNLGCSYCYAQEGSFGSEPKSMERDVALAAVDLLFKESNQGETVNLSFLGGEPLLNRALVRDCTEAAATIGRNLGIHVNFSITTNGTMLTPGDAEFFELHGFAVTVSLDGIGDVHDGLRPFRGGQSSYSKIIANVSPLLKIQRRMQVSARVTVTPKNLHLRETLDELLKLGFHSVGFSPMLHSPAGREEMHSEDLSEMLRQMIECGEEFERRTSRGERYAFANAATAIQEIHKGTHRPYPCGAGGGYFGVSAEGGLYACHRFVQDDSAYFGDVVQGVDPTAQSNWLRDRHVHSQSPCSGCWARYLCGGGCHHEVIKRGRPACDYIRGWLHHCLQTYVRLRITAPEYFA